MKQSFLPIFLFAVCLSLMAFTCEDSNPNMGDEEKALTIDKKVIEDLVATSICNETTTCSYIAFGSKACGGPKSYLVYSTSIDVSYLETLVVNYNKKEAEFNVKWGIISDCSYLLPPSSVKCENNKCIAVY